MMPPKMERKTSPRASRALSAEARQAITRTLRVPKPGPRPDPARVAQAARRLRRQLGAEAVLNGEGDAAAFSGDKWFAATPPDLVVRPRSVAQVAAVLKTAAAFSLPVTPRGAGYGCVGGCVPRHGGIALDMTGMDRILEISTADGVARVEAGVVTGRLQKAVRELGWFYPPDPASLRHSTIGGNIAANAGGPRCLKYGVTRNYVLGLTVVLPGGQIARVGGRTVKNKVGFDFTGLFTGSEGMLGVIAEAVLRIIPHPPQRAALSCCFATMPAAAKAVQEVFQAGFLPAALEIADAFTLESARKHLGADLVPPGKSHLLLEVDGQEKTVAAEIAMLAELMKKLGALSIDQAAGEEGCERLWGLRRGFSESLKATGLTKLNEDVVVPRGRLVDLMRFAAGLQKKHGFPVACFGHAGDGNIHVNIMVPDPSDKAVQRKMSLALDELFAQVIAWEGAITGEHGVGLAKARWWPRAADKTLDALHRAVKNAIDPAGMMNPGKFLG